MVDEVRGRGDRAERALAEVARNRERVTEQLGDLLELVHLVRRERRHRQAARLAGTPPTTR